jgi:hypothetical protein
MTQDTITLVITIVLATLAGLFYTNGRFGDLHKRMDEMSKRIDDVGTRIETAQTDLGTRIETVHRDLVALRTEIHTDLSHIRDLLQEALRART